MGSTLGVMREYYDARAPEYDDWYLGRGLFSERERPGWERELAALERALAVAHLRSHPRRRLWNRLPDPSPSGRDGRARPERADARDRPRALPGGGLRPGRRLRAAVQRTVASSASSRRTSTATSIRSERALFLAEAARVAPELVVCDAARPTRPRSRGAAGARSSRTARAGRSTSASSCAEELAAELGGGEVMFAGDWFVVVRA